jgi:hypothetical protein
MIAGVTRIQYPIYFFLNQVPICLSCPRISELCRIFEKSLIYPYIKSVLLPVSRQQNGLSFLCI